MKRDDGWKTKVLNWLKSLFARQPVQCRSCAKRDREVSFKAVPGDEYGFGTRPALAPFCGDKMPGFPRAKNCTGYQYTWIQGDVDQEYER